ncbi:MAG: vitamin B12 dependent-methionine synthase activation domain-containing protein, partial [Bacteroidota bacterium]
AKKLFNDAQEMLKKIIDGKMVTANGAIGFYPCNAVGDDVEIYSDATRSKVIANFRFLRNQQKREDNSSNNALSDFIKPVESGDIDYLGLFAVTAGINADTWAKYYQDQLDDYNSIMVKVLSDRLAEAFAELMHERVRKEFWGYDKDEHLAVTQMLKEEYRGIRPAPGYPACPEHSEKLVLFNLLDTEGKTGIQLTENYAMYPAASVSGFYFAHPEANYFGLGKISKDQLEDYAVRKGITVEQAEKYLNTNLNYQ